MSIDAFLNSERDKYINLIDAVDDIAKANSAQETEAATALIRLLEEDIKGVFYEERGAYFERRDVIDDTFTPVSLGVIAALGELKRIEITGSAYKKPIFDSHRGYDVVASHEFIEYPKAEGLYFKKSELSKALNDKNIKHGLGDYSNVPELYKHRKTLEAWEANLIINNIDPYEAEANINYFQCPPIEVDLLEKVIDDHLDELHLIDTGRHWTDESDRVFKQSTWREWCKRHGHKWHVPEAEATTPEAEATTDPELIKRIDTLQAELNGAKAENNNLRESLANAQAEIDKLRAVASVRFDENDPKYPPELHLCFQAWEYAKNNHIDGKGKTPKQTISLQLQRMGVSDTGAIDRIATVANWNKKGGVAKLGE